MLKGIFKYQRHQLCLLVTALTAVAGVAACTGPDPSGGYSVSLETVALKASEAVEASESLGEETLCEMIYVYVCGCVNAPGVYALKPQSRIYEAIEAAGGMSESAAEDCINLAKKLEDQMQVYVPSREEAAAKTGYPGADGDGDAGNPADSKININTATAAQLDALPGIGALKADDIVKYREEHGGFASIEELMNIPGIKSGVFDKIKELVTVD